jgi:hypothetical protein
MNRVGIMLHARCVRRHIAAIVFSLRGVWRSLFQNRE